ncbi:hypothetical protein LIER_18903 [Lithospermum erythrorhizon]|uniref:Ternary complex factor MIP1, leucine-zipper n=1 Tax=Lithospermum erythrorhizon TaxID=34254 RepID=A0AAV3QL64_LITER
MNTNVNKAFQTVKAQMKNDKEKGMNSSRIMDSGKATMIQRGSIRARKMALLEDVDKLKQKLRHEENVHRALERAFNRPLGALPRIPSYLPPDTMELLAEVAVLEEEVVRLEEQVVNCRQGLYQEAVHISSSKRSIDNLSDSYDLCQAKDPKPNQSKLSLQTAVDSATSTGSHSSSPSDDRLGKESKSCSTYEKHDRKSPNLKIQSKKTSIKRPPRQCKALDNHSDPRRLQVENRIGNHGNVRGKNSNVQGLKSARDYNPNKVSESIMKCLLNIFLRTSMHMTDTTSSLSGKSFRDPYGICSEFERRDIGPYRDLIVIEANSMNPNRTILSVFLVHRLKLLFDKLAHVDLVGLSHQEKLAFWINIYNSCMMNAFLDYGIPGSPEMIMELMQKATINVGGHWLNPITIEHFILRLPYHSKYTIGKGIKNDVMTTRNIFGLELSEPLVTFALSSGSWSSPAVKVYSASKIEDELEAAKKEYLQAAIGISTKNKVVAIPKLLEWYLLDFAKDLESLLDWIFLQLPCELGKEAIECLERKKDKPLTQVLKIMPYEFNFRYLIHA